MWILIAIALLLLIIWLLRQPKQGATASNAPTAQPADTLPAGQDRTPKPSARRESVPFKQTPESVWRRDVQQLLNQGQKIAAIKRVRAETQWGLQDAKAYVDALQNADPVLAPVEIQPTTQGPAPTAPTLTLEEKVIAFLANHQKVSAVKLVRDETGWDLRASKDYVDRLERLPPPFDLASGRPTAALRADVQHLLASHQKFAAIERVHQVTGWDMNRAMEYVNALQRSTDT